MRTRTATQPRLLPVLAAALPMARVAATHLHGMPVMRTAGRLRG